jgi:hypothetical protein
VVASRYAASAVYKIEREGKTQTVTPKKKTAKAENQLSLF